MRFNVNKYKPTDDSSEAFRTHDPISVVLNINTKTVGEGDKAVVVHSCPCGCGEFPKGKNTKFVMGHDARLKGILMRAHVTGTPIIQLENGNTVTGVERSALTVAKQYGWDGFVVAAKQRYDDHAKAKAEAAKTRQAAADARTKAAGVAKKAAAKTKAARKPAAKKAGKAAPKKAAVVEVVEATPVPA